MNDTMVTLVGNAATAPVFMESALGTGSVRLRLAVTARRYDREQDAWVDGPTSFYTVWARRALAGNLAGSVDVGDPLVVYGRLRVKDEAKDDRRWLSADVDAVAVGHDLTRGTSAFRRVAKADPRLVEPASVRAAAAAPESGGPPRAGSPATVGWGGEIPVNWAARGAPGKQPPEPDPEKGTARTPEQPVGAVS
ncbi:single-stranded DNA-binding protein [Streptomyces sp. NPDC087440]|uniref:single-stranded DNA-binding protein n=1 Tax=Streptomyces sp. NPDC087440 TaxID=3365790 RepID=UPI0037F2D25A